MKCWKCGQENSIGSTYCLNCGMSLERTPVKTSVGKAMRELYDKYGCQKVLTENAYLKNGLGDFLEDSNRSRIIRNQVGTVMDVGLGKVYYEQLEKGRPDNAFKMRVRELITRSCGFNDYTANEIMGYFDEMIGWKAAEPSVVSPNKKPSSVPPQNHKKTQTEPKIKAAKQNQDKPLSSSEIKRKKAIFVISYIAIVLWGALYVVLARYYFTNTASEIVLFIFFIIGIVLLCYINKLANDWADKDRRTREESQNKSL